MSEKSAPKHDEHGESSLECCLAATVGLPNCRKRRERAQYTATMYHCTTIRATLAPLGHTPRGVPVR
jgi:hypothetical protein